METFRDPSIEEINSLRIAEINLRQNIWTAGRTSLIGESFSEVLAYRMGELPASDLERSGDKTAVREFLKEMEDNASFDWCTHMERGGGSWSSYFRNNKELISMGTPGVTWK